MPPLLCLAALVHCVAAPEPDELPYSVGSWPEDGLGNQRVVVEVAADAEAVVVHLPWRRRDQHPEAKDLRVFELASGRRVTNVVPLEVRREWGEIAFQPTAGAARYAVYYLPYPAPRGNFGDPGTYFPPEDTADAAWRAAHGLAADQLASGRWRELPRATAVELQARTEFDRGDPMEVVASPDEVAGLLTKHPDRPYLVFPEDRLHPVRMADDLPLRWIQSGPGDAFEGDARPGEYFVFQLGLWAARQPLAGVELRHGDLRGPGGATIGASALTCFNLAGTDWLGRPLHPTFVVGQGQVRPLWLGVQIPRDATGGYEVDLEVRPQGLPATTVHLVLKVSGAVLEDAGDNELWRLSRLRWLNSTIALDDEVIPPFTPLQVQGDTIRCLGRAVRFGPTGLPASITSRGVEILAAPTAWLVITDHGPVSWTAEPTRTLHQAPGAVERQAAAGGAGLRLTTWARMEMDGCILFRSTLTADQPTRILDARLELPLRREVATYLMGFSRRGGLRPSELHWEWNVGRADNMVWLGDVEAGLQLKLCPDKDDWELLDLHTAGLPPGWHNDGKGGCEVTEEADRVMVRATSGGRDLVAGESVEFRYRLLITPFKPIDPNHWNWRYGGVNEGGNIAHVHHGTPQNPYINYPFLTTDKLAALVAEAKAGRFRDVAQGQLTYPAKGNLDLGHGALHVWVRVNFDPHAGEAQQSRYNQSLFALDWPNGDQLGFYWNIDDRGMRTYIRQGPPEHNRYPVLFGTHSPDWEQGQKHLLTLSWGDELAIWVDGEKLGSGTWSPAIYGPLDEAVLQFRGRGFGIDAIKVDDQAYAGGEVQPSADTAALLLDTFAAWDGGAATQPEQGSPGAVEGVCEKTDAGELVCSARQEPVPPSGVNVYYTVRELSNHVAELWPLRSLGDEVFRSDQHFVYAVEALRIATEGGGYPWLREHLVSGYVPAWRQPLPDGEVDAAIATQGLSRWHNYYLEGLRWLMQHTGVDGLYLDGIGYDREIMKRVAKVMVRTNPGYRINFHSGDNFSPPWDPGRGTSPANQYLEHFPYLTNLWFGELYDYDMPPDYWLVEISGLPFGLTGEMLNYQNGGNPYRGMIYGMTGRMHPSKPAMWRFWNEFGIQDAEMIGYWRRDCPVRTDRDDVLATVYRKKGESLMALASWPTRPGPRTARINPSQDRLAIDGDWPQAAHLARFSGLGSDQAAAQPTEVRVACDAEALYLAVRCTHAGPPPKAEVTTRDGNVWEDDAVEVFLQPDPAQAEVYQLIVNSRGTQYDGRNQDAGWNGDWRCTARVDDGFWEARLRVPWSTLGLSSPAEGASIGCNVCRDRQTPAQELSSWSPAGSTFHDLRSLGRLVVTSAAPPTHDADRVEPAVEPVQLRIDWRALGLDPARATLRAPAIEHFQEAATFDPHQPVPVAAGRGWLLVLGG